MRNCYTDKNVFKKDNLFCFKRTKQSASEIVLRNTKETTTATIINGGFFVFLSKFRRKHIIIHLSRLFFCNSLWHNVIFMYSKKPSMLKRNHRRFFIIYGGSLPHSLLFNTLPSKFGRQARLHTLSAFLRRLIPQSLAQHLSRE